MKNWIPSNKCAETTRLIPRLPKKKRGIGFEIKFAPETLQNHNIIKSRKKCLVFRLVVQKDSGLRTSMSKTGRYNNNQDLQRDVPKGVKSILETLPRQDLKNIQTLACIMKQCHLPSAGQIPCLFPCIYHILHRKFCKSFIVHQFYSIPLETDTINVF